MFDDSYWDIPAHLFDSEEELEEKAHIPNCIPEKNIMDAPPQSESDSLMKKVEKRNPGHANLSTSSSAPKQTYSLQRSRQGTNEQSTWQTHLPTNRLPPDTLTNKSVRNENTDASPCSSMRSRLKTTSAAAVVNPHSPMWSNKKEVKESYSMLQSARTSPIIKKDENIVTTSKGNTQQVASSLSSQGG